MKIIKEQKLSDFEFYLSELPDYLTEEEFNIIENELEYLYPEGLTEDEINRMFETQEDYIVGLIDYTSYEEFINERQ